jgi:hypothetical protein
MKIQVRHFWLWDDQLFYAKDVEDRCTQQGRMLCFHDASIIPTISTLTNGYRSSLHRIG